ncbi:MAG: hypothetical protein KC912_04620 [Proteobacteria bacterium]|nr:hypothetical protein [Pseudomonadota bacterium]
MQPSLAVVRPSGFTPSTTPPPLVELHYALHAVGDETLLWLSSARAGTMAEAWITAGPGGLLCAGSADHAAHVLVSPLSVEWSRPSHLRDPGRGPSFRWTSHADGSALLRSACASLAAAALFARLDELLESVGAPLLGLNERDVLREPLEEGSTRRVLLRRTRTTWRLTIESRIEGRRSSTTSWVANDRSGWRTNWSW